jgi:endonuclease/exonuclease/phosphatase family metal-dependent hydrolase
MKHIYLKIAFVYIRPNKATKTLINTLLNSFDCKDCDLIMGDFNLNRRNPNEYERLIQLCQEDKLEAVLKEPTTKSYHQPDHILVDKSLKERVFATSFFNFISDHKSIVARIGVGNDTLL